MTSKKKTSVRAGSKPTNKPKTERARRAPSAETAGRIVKTEVGGQTASSASPASPASPTPAPAPAPAPTIAQDAAEARPAKGRGKRGRAAHAGSSPKPEAKARTPKAPKERRPKKVSGLDAAAMVLAEAGTPMRAIDMLAAIQKRGLWVSKGKTPEATLYAAIIREIAAKGGASRFKKHDRGLFAARA